jgi:hypothetical protein
MIQTDQSNPKLEEGKEHYEIKEALMKSLKS